MADPKLPTPRTATSQPAAGGADADIESFMNGVDGSVRNSLVVQIRKLVEKNPEAFVAGMRRFLHEGRED